MNLRALLRLRKPATNAMRVPPYVLVDGLPVSVEPCAGLPPRQSDDGLRVTAETKR